MLGDMIRDIIAAAATMVEAKNKEIKVSAYRDWVDVTNQMIITTGNAIERGIHIEPIMKEGHTRGGWLSLLLAMKAEVESGVEDIDGFHENTIVAQGVYHGALQKAVEAEKDTLKSMIVRMMEHINLLKGKVGIRIVEEIAKAKKVEAEKKKEAKDRKRKNEDKVEAERRARVQREEENRRKTAEEQAAVEEEQQKNREEQARAKVEQLEKEKQRLVEERPGHKSTTVEMITWAQMALEAEEKQKKAVEEV